MKKDILYIDLSKFMAIIQASGLKATEQSGYIRVDGAKGRRVYVANTKRVGRVDISGFELATGAHVPHMGVTGNVKQQLDLSPTLGEEGILASFGNLLTTLKNLPPVEKPAKPAPEASATPATPKQAKKVEGTTPAKKVETPEEKKKRMDLIAQVAATKGVKVSKKSEAHAK